MKNQQYLVACMNCAFLIWPTATLGAHTDDLHVTGYFNLHGHISEIALQKPTFQILPYIAVCSTTSSAGPERIEGQTKNLYIQVRSENELRGGRNTILSQWKKQERSNTWVCKKKKKKVDDQLL